jgi:hypothetical protein
VIQPLADETEDYVIREKERHDLIAQSLPRNLPTDYRNNRFELRDISGAKARSKAVSVTGFGGL